MLRVGQRIQIHNRRPDCGSEMDRSGVVGDQYCRLRYQRPELAEIETARKRMTVGHAVPDFIHQSGFLGAASEDEGASGGCGKLTRDGAPVAGRIAP